MSEATPSVLLEKQRNVTIITLNRPQRLNAINGALLTQLTEAMQEFDADPDVTLGAARKAVLASRLIESAQQAFRAGRTHVARRAFDLARQLTPRPTIRGGKKYRMAARVLGLENAEKAVRVAIALRSRIGG